VTIRHRSISIRPSSAVPRRHIQARLAAAAAGFGAPAHEPRHRAHGSVRPAKLSQNAAMSGAPDFSPLAAEYARSRPRYPAALFDWLAGQVDRHELAWDAATGNGQAAASLALRFTRVVATDVSAEQLRHAFPAPNVEYRLGRAEEVDLPDSVVDLVTVAAAIHWFDLARFAATVRRVARPRGVVAAWSYHVGRCTEPVGAVLHRLYHGVLHDYFAPGARLVDAGYNSVELPGEPVAAPPFFAEAEWDLEQLRGFVRSWSGYEEYRRRHGRDPLDLVADELEAAWGGPERVHPLRFPLHLKVARLPG
jgi:SAM-dependent methyltransferase